MPRIAILKTDVREERGFTLIELLVVVLIIGILAAVAIPSFLSQREKAYDAGAKTLVTSAQNVAEVIGTDNDGEYKKVGLGEIHAYEKAIPTTEVTAAGGAWLTTAESVGGSFSGYKVTATAAHTGSTYTIERSEVGQVSRSCVAGTNDPKACSGW